MNSAKDVTATFALAPVNGVCGTANGTTLSSIPTTNLCGDNSLPAVTDSGPWGWTCIGQNGGTNAPCSANLLDTTSPVITFTTIPMNYSNQALGTIAFSANEPSTFECKMDNGSYSSCTSPYSYSSLPNGQHIFTIRATDSVANSVEKSFTWTVNTALSTSSAILLPQTGQTSCWNTDGDLITCDDSGQDGDIQAGVPWPNPRFVDNLDGTISDNLTGLNWSKDRVLPPWPRSWQTSLTYIDTLNNQNYLGHNDWRMPNILEAHSLMNLQQASDWLGSQGFNGDYGFSTWTSTTCGDNGNGALQSMGVSDQQCVGTMGTGVVWPVRGGQTEFTGALTPPKTGQTVCRDEAGSIMNCTGTGQDGELQKGIVWPSPRFTYNGDQTMSDNLTGLIWSKEAKPALPTIIWQESFDQIKNLNNQSYLGHSDWRLPNLLELSSLMSWQIPNMASWLTSQGFINVEPSGLYWTSSSSYYASNAWFAD